MQHQTRTYTMATDVNLGFSLLELFIYSFIQFYAPLVPGIGAVVAMVMGPAAITVQWALAYSGGLPVLYFDLSFRRINTSEWRAPMGSEAVTTGMGMGPPPISGHTRSLTVHGLESEELYEFRVLAANELGKGMFVKSEPILSHPIGT